MGDTDKLGVVAAPAGLEGVLSQLGDDVEPGLVVRATRRVLLGVQGAVVARWRYGEPAPGGGAGLMPAPLATEFDPPAVAQRGASGS